MKRWGRLLAYTLLGIFAVVVVAVGVATWWFALRPLPPTQGALRVPGLSAEVSDLRLTAERMADRRHRLATVVVQRGPAASDAQPKQEDNA